MTESGGRLARTIVVSLLLLAAPRFGAAASLDSASADSVLRLAADAFARPSPDRRREALDALERASRLAPDRADVWLAYGRACLEAGRFARARDCLARAGRLSPNDPDAWRALGTAWKKDWLSSLERTSLDEAARCFARAGERSSEPGDWLELAALSILRGRPREGILAGLRARAAAPDDPEPLLVLGAALFRSGEGALADSAFERARASLAPAWLARFDDASVLGLPPGAAAGTGDRAWRERDPDLTTPENEALLDYRTRVTLALLLFRERGEIRWDKRADLFARYGPPSSIEYNPARRQTGWDAELEFHFPRHGTDNAYAPDAMPYPFNLQIWHYDELGIEVDLWDRSLAQHYELPYADRTTNEPRPDPAALAGREDLVVLGDGQGVFRAMVPGSRPIPVVAVLERFPQADGVRVLAHVATAGGWTDSLRATWALVTAEGRVIARESRPLSVSACDPSTRLVADFATTVPPGAYRVDFSVVGTGARRGLAHLATRVTADSGLAMSDLVLLCTEPGLAIGREGIRLEPNLDGRIGRARTAVVYYELDHLATDPGGEARFSYTYAVHALGSDGRGDPDRAPVFKATREERSAGTHRREFVSVPVADLRPGTYELRLEVEDLASGERETGRLRFVKGTSDAR